LTLDKQLKAMKVNFTVVEYLHADMLINGYATKVKQSITIDLRYGENYAASSIYPEKSPLDTSKIRQWIVNAVKKVAPEYLHVADQVIPASRVDVAPANVVANEPEVKVKSSLPQTALQSDDATAAPAETDLESTASGLFKLGLGVGGTLLVAAMAIAGVAMGSLAADRFNNDDDEFDNAATPDECPLYLEGFDGSKLDFAKIWEERPPGSAQTSKSKTTTSKMAAPMNSTPKTEKSSDSEPKPKSNGPFDIEDPTTSVQRN
jgi:hypothetical protein